MRQNGGNWAAAWTKLPNKLGDVTLGNRIIGASSFESVSNYLDAIDFLIVSHHGLLQSEDRGGTLPTSKGRHVRRQPSIEQITPQGTVAGEILQDYWRLERELTESIVNNDSFFWRGLLVYARAALIFADHVVSSQKAIKQEENSELFANTARENGARKLNQTLNWHLRQVAKTAKDTMWRMSQLTAPNEMRQLGQFELPGLSEESVASITSMSEPSSRFAWQNTCAQALMQMRKLFPDRPTLVFNMASTGSGKTRMNARVACLLSRDRSPRIAIALNLRTLTLQTGEALRRGMDLGEDEIAIVVGDRTAQDLFNTGKGLDTITVRDVDNVDENPLDEEIDCFGEEHLLPQWLEALFTKERERVVVGAPLLVSTVDFLAAAGMPGSQGHHVKALLRLMTSDLVLDEIDGYEPLSLVAILRLVQLSALFRRNVVCSSATLSKPVAMAIERAYKSGVMMWERLEACDNVIQSKSATIPLIGGFVRALIDDDLEPLIEAVASGSDNFEQVYSYRLETIQNNLLNKPQFRLAAPQAVNKVNPEGWIGAVKEAVEELHAGNAWSFGDNKRVSFGLVRVANVSTAIEVARAIATGVQGCRVACYHSADFVISRFYKERCLDKLLSRSSGDEHIRNDPQIKAVMSGTSLNSMAFIVVATPVEEIGRDHDFDWAVIEPSSAQSIVQTSGRVNRHRLVPRLGCPNVKIMQFNFRHCKNAASGRAENAAFMWPGYEARPKSHKRHPNYGDHDINKLLYWTGGSLKIDASLRFDTKRVALARADDLAIEELLKPFYGTTGCFIRNPVDVWILTNGPYLETQLRDVLLPRQSWRVKNRDGRPEFQRKERVEDGGRLVDRWLDESMVTHEMHPNAWLGLSVGDMEALCEQTGVSIENGLCVELMSLYSGELFAYEEGFGIRRLRAAERM